MKLSGILLFILILSGFSGPRCAAAVWNSDGTPQNIQQIHDTQAQNGDTITIPAGTFTWSTGITITKAITLQGAGVGSTIIRDDVQSAQLIQWSLPAGLPSRITGIEFQDGGRSNWQSDILLAVGSNTNGSKFRLDHCKWNNLNGASVFDTVIGVIDHNTFVMDRTGLPINIYGSYWDGRTLGDGSWAASTGFGSSQFLFIEDNTFTHSDASQKGITDSYGGGRFVVRHNNIFNGLISNHGTESTGRTRGGRAMEVYNNTFTGTDLNRFVGGVRSGGVLFHDNSISGYWGDSATFTLENFRNFYPFDPWGGADGTNPWDVNEPNAYFTGTAAANSANRTVTVSGANWTTNYWTGYAIRRTSDVCNSGSISFSEILSNTSNTITYSENGGYPTPPPLAFCAGDSLEIRKVVHALDQPGRALGSLITGNPPIRPPGWNDQVTEPCYSWNNTTGNAQVNFSAGPGVRADVHYFNDNPMPGYTPYVYPHPLVTGTGTPTPTPTGTPTPTPTPSASPTSTATPTSTPTATATSTPPSTPTPPPPTPTPTATTTPTPSAATTDFNGDGHPDWVVRNAATGQTAIWYLNNNVYVSSAYGPTLAAGWGLRALGDFNHDSHPDYGLFALNTDQTAIWYLSGPSYIGGAYAPTLPSGWELVATADFNGDSKPDYVLYNSGTNQTAIWYMNNNVYAGGGYGPTLPPGWTVVGAADFDRDGHPDYLLFHPSSGYTAIGYLSGLTLVGAAWGPILPSGWTLVATTDFNGDGNPDYTLYETDTRQTAIWYLNNNVYTGAAFGPTLPEGWTLAAP